MSTDAQAGTHLFEALEAGLLAARPDVVQHGCVQLLGATELLEVTPLQPVRLRPLVHGMLVRHDDGDGERLTTTTTTSVNTHTR